MGLFERSTYERWKKEVDGYQVLQKGKTPGMTVESLTTNLKGGADLIRKIQEAGKRGELKTSEVTELVQHFQKRARAGLNVSR